MLRARDGIAAQREKQVHNAMSHILLCVPMTVSLEVGSKSQVQAQVLD